jgi:hypothetical protein
MGLISTISLTIGGGGGGAPEDARCRLAVATREGDFGASSRPAP